MLVWPVQSPELRRAPCSDQNSAVVVVKFLIILNKGSLYIPIVH